MSSDETNAAERRVIAAAKALIAASRSSILTDHWTELERSVRALAVDCGALRLAVGIFRAHKLLLVDAAMDLQEGGEGPLSYSEAENTIEGAIDAFEHVIDGFRSSETRGGS